jgi:uncharacterized protein (DUF983 family)
MRHHKSEDILWVGRSTKRPQKQADIAFGFGDECRTIFVRYEMRLETVTSVIHGVAYQLCPHCRMERIFRYSIFRGFPAMRAVCPLCGLKFEREEGYFVGAMIVDYGLGLVIAGAIGCVLWYFTRWPLDKTALVAFLIFLPFVPTLTRFGRVVWIYIDRLLDPEDEEFG